MPAANVVCTCGKAISVPSEYRGRSIRCPGCQHVVSIAANQNTAFVAPEIFAEVQSAKCPKCRQEWPKNTVVCINCGYNFKTGSKLKTKYKVRDTVVEVGVPLLGTYQRFAIGRDPDGEVTFFWNQWLLWVPIGSTTARLRDYDDVAIDHGIGGDRCADHNFFAVELQGGGKRPCPVWHGRNEATMQRIVDLFKSAGLTIKRK
jgi:hypothetical protein